MSQSDEDRVYADQMFDEFYGDRAAALTPQRLSAARELFSDIMWHEGIEALTPARLDTILDYAALECPDELTPELMPDAA